MAVFGFDERTTHVGFTDESSWSEKESNFRSIACISASVEDYCEIESRLYAARCKAGAKMTELKWNEDWTETRGGKEQQRDMDHIVQTALVLAVEQKLRIDVVIWDKKDRMLMEQKHEIRKMKDVQYYRFMYQALITKVIKRWRTSEDTNSHYWSIAPDQHSGLKTKVLQKLVQSEVIPENEGVTEVQIIEETDAPNYSLQLVDVFAGLGAYSHNYSQNYEEWLEQENLTRSKFSTTQVVLRFPILNRLRKQCSDNNFGVTILKPVTGFRGRGLWTRDSNRPEHPINFWCYTP